MILSHPHPDPPPSEGEGELYAGWRCHRELLPPLRGKEGMGGMPNERARNLRKNLTEAEKALWSRLRLKQISGHRFRRQVPIGAYVADFVCLEKRLIVEVDDGQHVERTARDHERTDWLKSQRFNVLRFWNHQVLQEMESVLEVIEKELNSPPTSILPREGGGK